MRTRASFRTTEPGISQRRASYPQAAKSALDDLGLPGRLTPERFTNSKRGVILHTKSLALLGTLVSAAIISAAPVATETLGTSASADTPTQIDISAFPSDATLKRLQVGDSFRMIPVPARIAKTSTDDYTITVDPAAVPDSVRSRAGVVNFQIQGLNPATRQVDTTALSLQVSPKDPTSWVAQAPLQREVSTSRSVFKSFSVHLDLTGTDQRALTGPDSGLASLPLTAAQKLAWGGAGDAEASSSNARVAQGSQFCNLRKTGRFWTTIGSSYPVGGDTSSLTYSSSESSTTGVAYNYGGAWQQEGSKSTDDEWGQDFARSKYMRTYRILVNYGLSECFNPVLGNHYNQVAPRFQTGGTWSYRLSGSRPDWHHCVPVARGDWWRGETRGTDYSLGAGVKMSDAIGINLSSSHRYSSGTRLYYHLPVARHLCGSGDVPTKASKLMERF